jgi:hypothetical protein
VKTWVSVDVSQGRGDPCALLWKKTDIPVLSPPGTPTVLVHEPVFMELGHDFVENAAGLAVPRFFPGKVTGGTVTFTFTLDVSHFLNECEKLVSFADALAPPLDPKGLPEVSDVVALRQAFPGVTEAARHPCDCPPFHSEIWSAIQHLNDVHHWTREAIADWLDTLDVDLTLAPASQGD